MAKKITKKTTGVSGRKVTHKAAPKAKKSGSNGTSDSSSDSQRRVSVQIGPRNPGLSVAPGVRVVGQAAESRRPTEGEDKSVRKLTKKETKDIRETLLLKREQLLHGMKRELADYRARAGSKSADEGDMAADAYDESLSFEIASTSDQELEEIERALEKIDDGSYGQCEECDAPISPSRLKILPFATTCAVCRAESERAKMRDGEPTWNMVSGSESEDEEE